MLSGPVTEEKRGYFMTCGGGEAERVTKETSTAVEKRYGKRKKDTGA